MEKSILNSIKKLLGIAEEYKQFDFDLIMLINSVFMDLNMLGVGSSDGYSISGKEEVWENFVGPRMDLAGIQMYVWLKVKLAWDPPQIGYLVDSMRKQIEELEWKINVQVETVGLNQLCGPRVTYVEVDE